MPSPNRARRRNSRALFAAAIALVVAAGIGGSAYAGYSPLKKQAAELEASLTADVLAAQAQLDAGKASLTAANQKHDPSLASAATIHFVAAEDQFRAVGQRADGNLLLRVLERLPRFGQIASSRHAALTGMAGMGVAMARAGQDLAAIETELLQPSGPVGRNLLTVLSTIQPSLIRARDDLRRAQANAADVDVHVLPISRQPTFLNERDATTSALAGVEEFERLIPVFTEALGGNGNRNYLIEQVNPAELRAGGGFIVTYTILRADHGTLRVITSGSSDLANPLPPPGQHGFIPQPSPLREVSPNTSWSFVDSNIYPDFPSNAKAAERFAESHLKIKLDAVFAIDFYAVARMLELTGPVVVPGYGTTLTASNFILQTMMADISGLKYKALLGVVASSLMQNVSTVPPSRLPELVGALNRLAAERHMQAYFNNSAAEQEIQGLGWAGGVNPTASKDYMTEVESNYYGDNANYFLSRHYSLVLTRKGETLHHQMTVDLVNNAKCGTGVLTSHRENIRLYISGAATSLSDNLIRVKYPDPSPPSGMRLLDGWLPAIPCGGGRGRAVFAYDTPWPVAEGGLHQIYWQKQAGTVDDRIDVTWTDGTGATFKAGGSLSEDRLISLSSTGLTLAAPQASQATFPSLGLG